MLRQLRSHLGLLLAIVSFALCLTLLVFRYRDGQCCETFDLTCRRLQMCFQSSQDQMSLSFQDDDQAWNLGTFFRSPAGPATTRRWHSTINLADCPERPDYSSYMLCQAYRPFLDGRRGWQTWRGLKVFAIDGPQAGADDIERRGWGVILPTWSATTFFVLWPTAWLLMAVTRRYRRLYQRGFAVTAADATVVPHSGQRSTEARRS